MEIKDAWQYELAATLCLVGCIALPDEVFERGYRGQPLSPEEIRIFNAHPQTAARLLSKIPRLEAVAEIICRQYSVDAEPAPAERPGYGAQLLPLALELDRRIYRGATVDAALAELRLVPRFDRLMLDALRDYAPAATECEIRRLSIRSLRPGMVLVNDVLSRDGSLLIFRAGTVLTETWIERLGNFAATHGTAETVAVRISIPPASLN